MSPIATQAGPVKVVLVFTEGERVEKGLLFGFAPNRDKLKLFPSENADEREAKEVEVRNLKAIFFVKEFTDLERHEKTHSGEFVAGAHGRKMEVTFVDGKRLVGTTEGYSPARVGFFLLTADPAGNNLRVFVINSSVRTVRWL